MASSETVNSLADIANTEFIRSLGKLSSERFTCGGALPKPSKVQVTYLNRDGQWNGIELLFLVCKMLIFSSLLNPLVLLFSEKERKQLLTCDEYFFETEGQL